MTEGTGTTTPSSSAPSRNRTAMLLSFGSLAVFDIGLSILLFSIARRHGATETVAYLIASVGPLLGMASEWVRTRRLGGASLIILAFTLLSALVALIGGDDSRLLLIKDGVLTGGFGLVILASMIPVFPKPLMFFFGLKFGSDGSKEGVAAWYGLWDKYPAFRRSQYVISIVWGVSFLLEAVIKIIFASTLPFDTAYTINQVAPFVVLAVVITWTIWYGQVQRKAGERRRAEADAAALLPS